VLINNHHPGNLVHSVGVDNVAGAQLITRHLIELGHRRIGYIGDRFGGQADKDRSNGYRAALRKARIRLAPELLVHAESSLDGGLRGIKQLLDLRARPTAVFCYDDITALGAYKAIRSAGLRVSKDISVAGFDDLFFSSCLEPSLTTIRQPMREMGERAMKLLLELVSPSQNGKLKKTQMIIPGKLMIRESTSAPS
jgi:DNA-binding LacI/PurR family transcriptional regulator